MRSILVLVFALLVPLAEAAQFQDLMNQVLPAPKQFDPRQEACMNGVPELNPIQVLPTKGEFLQVEHSKPITRIGLLLRPRLI